MPASPTQWRPRRRLRRRALVLLGLAVLAGLQAWRSCRTAPAPQPLAEGIHRVDRVVDGDTLLLAGGQRIRLIGVDTPETVRPDHPVEPWGHEAAEFTRRFVAVGPVRLTFDRERRDRFERYLAYVWVGDRLLNEELLRAGLARWEPGYHYAQAMKTRFRRAQQEAQKAERGLWSATGP
ncbi:MAG: thermonuclease family protein [Planctomycetia bacterium]|nr:thermonuclease family protein [Planctomycetia bacterium]